MNAIVLKNRTYDELQVVDTASLGRIAGRDDIDLFAKVSGGDVNHERFETPSGVIFVLTFGIFLGALLRRILPEDQLDEHVKGIVRLGVGLIAAIASLVLGLLIAAGQVRQITAVQYGPEARPLREQIHGTVGPFATGSGAKRRPSLALFALSTACGMEHSWIC